MREFGIVIFPNDILDLVKMHCPGVLPRDCKAMGWHLDARKEAIVIDFQTEEDLGKGIIPIGGVADRFRQN